MEPPTAPVQRLSPDQLDNLVVPVALYPDPMLGQVLLGSTYSPELVEAEQWLKANPSLRGTQLTNAAEQQNWDPSVQAMVAFPEVLNAYIEHPLDHGLGECVPVAAIRRDGRGGRRPTPLNLREYR